MPRPASPDALIFDLDGTLWDTCATCAAAWNRVVERLQIAFRPITAEDVRSVAGRPHLEGIGRVFAGLSEREIHRLCAETELEDNRAVAEQGGILFPAVRETIPRLRALAPLLIVSNCQAGYVETFFEWSGLGEHFLDFECWGRTGETKSANLRALIARNGLSSPWLIGDTEGDLEAARDNGVGFIHASYGFGRVTACDARIERFSDLGGLLAWER